MQAPRKRLVEEAEGISPRWKRGSLQLNEGFVWKSQTTCTPAHMQTLYVCNPRLKSAPQLEINPEAGLRNQGEIHFLSHSLHRLSSELLKSYSTTWFVAMDCLLLITNPPTHTHKHTHITTLQQPS